MSYAPPKRTNTSPLQNSISTSDPHPPTGPKPPLNRTLTSTATANASVTFDSLGIPPAQDEPPKPTLARRGSSWIRSKHGIGHMNTGREPGYESVASIDRVLSEEGEAPVGEAGAASSAGEEGDSKKKKKVRWGVARVMGKLLPKELKDK